MVQYYPLSRIKQNLYTRGNQYATPDGKPYSGKYYLTFEGEAYTGANPYVGTNILLKEITNNDTLVQTNLSGVSAFVNKNVQGATIATPVEINTIIPYYPIPLESDYQRGYFTRYFAKYLTGPGYIVEINEDTFSDISNGLTQQIYLSYEVDSMFWQLTGPRNNTRVSQYQIKGGVFDTNKRVTEAKEATFKGIISYIGGDYTKFARLT